MQPNDPGAIAGRSAFANRQFSCSSLARASATLLRAAAPVAILTATVLLAAAAPPVAETPNHDETDLSIKPGNDFYRYANGGWLRTVVIPAGKSSYDTRAWVNEKTSQRVRELIQEAASGHSAKGSVAQKVGDYYASFMDENGIEAKMLTPLADEMAQISAITNTASLCPHISARP